MKIATYRVGGERRLQALVGERRRQADVNDGHIRPLGQQRGERGGSVVHCRHDGMAIGLNQANQPVPEQEQVLGYDNTHGMTIVIRVGPPAGL